MAVEMVLIDDIDGGPADETVELSVNGAKVLLDLSQKNANKLAAQLRPWMEAGRKPSAKANGARPRATKTAPTKSNRPPGQAEQMQAIRDWAKKKNMKVSDRGRIPKDVVDRFNKEFESAR